MIVLSIFNIVIEGVSIAGSHAEQPRISARQTISIFAEAGQPGHDVREAQPNIPG